MCFVGEDTGLGYAGVKWELLPWECTAAHSWRNRSIIVLCTTTSGRQVVQAIHGLGPKALFHVRLPKPLPCLLWCWEMPESAPGPLCGPK